MLKIKDHKASKSVQAPKRMRFIGTLNNPQEHYKDFMAQDWLQALHTKLACTYTVGQLEKGEEGTIHLQYAIFLPKEK